MEENIHILEEQAKNIRRDVVKMIHDAKSGHPGGSLSCVDILVAVYSKMNLNLGEDSRRIDKFVLSKGHAAPAYYAMLSQKGFIDHSELFTLRKIDSHLEGHPCNKINGVDVSSGSLGQGLSIANGMVLSKKINNKEGKVFCLCGDGEIEEGQIWEAMMTSNKYKLNNLILIIDKNGLQIDGTTVEVKNINSLEEKVKSFGFNVVSVDGHDIKELINAIDSSEKSELPTCIIAKTIKGKGVKFMENKVEWHGKALTDEELELALNDLR